jgi:hypothetical protein
MAVHGASAKEAVTKMSSLVMLLKAPIMAAFARQGRI